MCGGQETISLELSWLPETTLGESGLRCLAVSLQPELQAGFVPVFLGQE